MKDTNLIDSYQANLPVQYASTLNPFTRSDADVVIDSEPHMCHTCKTSLMFAHLAVHVQTGCSTFHFTLVLISLFYMFIIKYNIQFLAFTYFASDLKYS